MPTSPLETAMGARSSLLQSLARYRETWAAGVALHTSFDSGEETAICDLFTRFVQATEACFERTNLAGHMTGSALVTDPGLERVLLTLHGKLGIWLQLGGHADGHPELHDVAWRETEEESGLKPLHWLSYEHLTGFVDATGPTPLPFDMDAHPIPATKKEPDHTHYDVRYLIVARDSDPLAITDESHDLRWFSLPEARRVTSERSMHRQFDKLEFLRKALGQG